MVSKVIRVESIELKSFKAAVSQLNDTNVGKVGWFPSAVYDDARGTPVATVAAVNEYGSPAKNIPARPFFRPAIAAYKNEWIDLSLKGARSILAGKHTADQVLELITARAAGQVAGAISNPLVYWEPLHPMTIARRLAKKTDKTTVGLLTKPLVDTGHMLATLDHEVSPE